MSSLMLLPIMPRMNFLMLYVGFPKNRFVKTLNPNVSILFHTIIFIPHAFKADFLGPFLFLNSAILISMKKNIYPL